MMIYVFTLIYILLAIIIGLAIITDFIKLSFENYISLFTLLGAWIGGIFTFKQWKETNKIKKAEYINMLTEKIRTDKDIKNTIYLFDYGDNWYDENFHDNKKIEIKIDKTLSYFSYICYLKKQKILSKKEFKFFEYQMIRILRNKNTILYLFNLYHFSKKNGTDMTFKYLFDYGKKIKIFDDDFFNLYSEKYENFLNIR